MKKLKILTALFIVFTITSIQQSSSVQSQNDMFNMSYIFFGHPSTYVQQVNKTKNSLKVVSPNYFDITEDGDLKVTWTLQSSFIDEMHNRGIRVVPFLANHWSSKAAINGLNNREELAKRVADEVKKYNLDGVNVDIEGIGHAHRDAHTDFIRLLRKYLPNKEVSVAVAGNPNNWKTGWHGFYDYKALSEYADYLMIMAYDESWESPDSPVGPVSSIQFFERSLQYAVNQGVPKDRIVMGLPFYGRMWKLDGPTESGVSITGKGVSSTRVKPLVDEYGGTINFDENTQSSFAKFTIPEGKNTFVGSTNLTAGDYVIWYENEPSIKAKLKLPSKYGIKGTGSWALYHETEDTWDYYTLWLNSRYFQDVRDNWAKASIQRVAEKGWMTGTSKTTFAPNRKLTRAEGAVIIVRALGKENYSPKQNKFQDTKNHWARKEIETARELGYINGTSETTFNPTGLLTREQLAQILYNVFDFPINENNRKSFPDVHPGRWSNDAITALSQQEYITGYPDGTFGPMITSTREIMAALMDRMADEFEQYND